MSTCREIAKAAEMTGGKRSIEKEETERDKRERYKKVMRDVRIQREYEMKIKSNCSAE